MADDIRLKRLEQNYELLRSELLRLKREAKLYQDQVQMTEAAAAGEVAALRDEVEQLRIENARLREEAGQPKGEA